MVPALSSRNTGHIGIVPDKLYWYSPERLIIEVPQENFLSTLDEIANTNTTSFLSRIRQIITRLNSNDHNILCKIPGFALKHSTSYNMTTNQFQIFMKYLPDFFGINV